MFSSDSPEKEQLAHNIETWIRALGIKEQTTHLVLFQVSEHIFTYSFSILESVKPKELLDAILLFPHFIGEIKHHRLYRGDIIFYGNYTGIEFTFNTTTILPFSSSSWEMKPNSPSSNEPVASVYHMVRKL